MAEQGGGMFADDYYRSLAQRRRDGTSQPMPTEFTRSGTHPRRVREYTMLGPLDVVNGAGWAPRVGATVSLRVFEDRFDIIEDGLTPIAEVRFTALRGVQISGHARSSGGNFFGGGFGLKGASRAWRWRAS